MKYSMEECHAEITKMQAAWTDGENRAVTDPIYNAEGVSEAEMRQAFQRARQTLGSVIEGIQEKARRVLEQHVIIGSGLVTYADPIAAHARISQEKCPTPFVDVTRIHFTGPTTKDLVNAVLLHLKTGADLENIIEPYMEDGRPKARNDNRTRREFAA